MPVLTRHDSADRELRLGMPHLAFVGLSETWLIMDCGHHHWAMLAAEIGHSMENLVDAEGDRVYASFVSHRVRGLLRQLQEGDQIQIRSRLRRLSSKRFHSIHSIRGPNDCEIQVEMISIFLRRRLANRNVTLVSCRPSCCEGSDEETSVNLEIMDRVIRGGVWQTHNGFSNASIESGLGEYIYRPAPSTDFNAARLLYFARYHEIVDRAEWKLCGEQSPLHATSERQIYYFGNMDPGDRVVARWVSQQEEPPGGFAHHFRLIRESDQRLMAEVFTWKGAASEKRRYECQTVGCNLP